VAAVNDGTVSVEVNTHKTKHVVFEAHSLKRNLRLTVLAAEISTLH
jgi:hypothetical protein